MYVCKHTHVGGSEGMLPQKIFLKIRHSEIASETTFGPKRQYQAVSLTNSLDIRLMYVLNSSAKYYVSMMLLGRSCTSRKLATI